MRRDLAVIAALAPSPWYITERDIFRQIGRDFFIPDCSSLHCTRVLASWILEQLPGPSLLKWKIYAVVGGTLAAIGTARLARQARYARCAVSSSCAGGAVVLGRGDQRPLPPARDSDLNR